MQMIFSGRRTGGSQTQSAAGAEKRSQAAGSPSRSSLRETSRTVAPGAAAGIGEAAARLFAREGARLVLVDLDAERLGALASELEAESVVVVEIAGDVSDRSLAPRIVERTMASFGRLDVLFNVAGLVLGGTLADCTDEEWQRTIDVNLKSMFLLARAAVPEMVRQGGGSIVNMASVAGPS